MFAMVCYNKRMSNFNKRVTKRAQDEDKTLSPMAIYLNVSTDQAEMIQEEINQDVTNHITERPVDVIGKAALIGFIKNPSGNNKQ